jgi:hypothetical protein
MATDMPRPGNAYMDAYEKGGSAWLFFAGTVLGLAGLMRIIDSIWAFTYSGQTPDNLQGAVLSDNLTAYAWTWLIVGVILVGSSLLILTRSQIARWVGYIAAVVLGLSAMTWMPYYPIWSLAYVGIAVLTFYALARHGGRQT